MTEEFDKWYEANFDPYEKDCGQEMTLYVLRAFVREVRSRREPSGVLMGDSANLGLAFDAVVRDFGLEEK